MAMTIKNLGGLNGEQSYVVTALRESGEPIKPHRSNEPLIMVGNVPLCTWSTLFSLLGGEVLVPDDAGGYALAPAWIKEPKAKT
jgi:hypothetical protein